MRFSRLRAGTARPTYRTFASKVWLKSGRSDASQHLSPLRTVRASFPAHGSSSSSDENPLTQVLNAGIDLLPVNLVPAIQGCYVLVAQLFHPCSELSRLISSGTTCSKSAPFRVGYHPIHRVMVSPGLSAGGFRFFEHPLPARDLGSSYDWLSLRQTPYRAYQVSHPVSNDALEACFIPGSG